MCFFITPFASFSSRMFVTSSFGLLEGCLVTSVPPPASPASQSPTPEAQITALGLEPPVRRSAGVGTGAVAWASTSSWTLISSSACLIASLMQSSFAVARVVVVIVDTAGEGEVEGRGHLDDGVVLVDGVLGAVSGRLVPGVSSADSSAGRPMPPRTPEMASS